ncbi:MAG: serine hydrolase domain-containing protein, partial [Oscillospiraceae bacterium]
MKIKTRILALVVAFACIMPMTGFMEEVKDSSEIKDSSDEMAQALTENYGVTSLQYALIDNGEIVKSDKAGVYSKTENRALTNEIMYGIGSISKMYTTAAVMKLVDNEKLELDTPLVNYIPEFVMADSRYKLITPRMLLNHSAGLYGTGYNRSFLFDDNDTFAHDNLLNRLASENLKADPGAFSVYCNDGFTLAEILVEKVSGISFTEFLDKEFFTPLNLKNTKTPLSDFDHKNLAKTYSPFDGTATLRDTINVIGAGGVYSTAEEVCKFGDLLTGRYPELLSKESVEAMQQSEYLKGVWPDSEDSIIGYGLGWDSVNMYPFNQYGIKAYTKGGDTGLYHASIVSVPQYNISATVLESGGSSIFATIMASQMILERLLERGVIDEIKEQMTFTAPVKTPMPEGIESFSGAYAATGNG